MTDGTAPDSVAIRARRTEKQWRHADRELASTHALWATLIGLHGAVAAVAGVLAGQTSSFSIDAFLWIGVVSLVSMVFLALLNYQSRAADRSRAKYFAVTSRRRSTWPQSFDKDVENQESQDTVARYLFWQRILEPLVMVFFLLNAVIFGYAVRAASLSVT